MKRNTMIKILRALAHDNGAGRVLYFRVSQVVFLSGVPRMTTYRYLKLAVSLGFAECDGVEYRSDVCAAYAITNVGRDFAGVVR